MSNFKHENDDFPLLTNLEKKIILVLGGDLTEFEEIIKEFLQKGKHPEIYEYVEKEYRITRKGSDQFYSLDKDQFQEEK